MHTERRNTLSLPQTSNNPPVMPAVQPPRKPSMIAKGHDRILKDLQDRGAKIEIGVTSTDKPYIGKMINRDKFTITIEESGTEKRMTIYKHAIEYFAERV